MHQNRMASRCKSTHRVPDAACKSAKTACLWHTKTRTPRVKPLIIVFGVNHFKLTKNPGRKLAAEAQLENELRLSAMDLSYIFGIVQMKFDALDITVLCNVRQRYGCRVIILLNVLFLTRHTICINPNLG